MDWNSRDNLCSHQLRRRIQNNYPAVNFVMHIGTGKYSRGVNCLKRFQSDFPRNSSPTEMGIIPRNMFVDDDALVEFLEVLFMVN